MGLGGLEKVADGPQTADDVGREVRIRQHVCNEPVRFPDDG